MGDGRRFLVTGATGLVGSEVVSRLVRQGHSVVAVTHRAVDLVDSAGQPIPTQPFGEHPATVSTISGDVRRTDLGMSPATRDSVVSSVDGIIHCAASTNFAAPQSVYDELNVGGTVHVCDLACAAELPLVYVGTAYVCGRREGTIPESDLSDAWGFANGYERSKYDAERHLRSVDGLRWSVVRPGIVTGYTRTGQIRDRKNLFTVLKLIVEGKLRTLPGRYDATLSLAPVDFVADVVVAAATDFEGASGCTFHAVGDTEVTLRHMSDVLAEYPSFEVARFVPRSSFAVDDLDPIEREYYLRIGTQYAEYFTGRRHFDASSTRDLMGSPPPDSGVDHLRSLLDESLEVGFLGSPLESIDEVIR